MKKKQKILKNVRNYSFIWKELLQMNNSFN